MLFIANKSIFDFVLRIIFYSKPFFWNTSHFLYKKEHYNNKKQLLLIWTTGKGAEKFLAWLRRDLSWAMKNTCYSI